MMGMKLVGLSKCKIEFPLVVMRTILMEKTLVRSEKEENGRAEEANSVQNSLVHQVTRGRRIKYSWEYLFFLI